MLWLMPPLLARISPLPHPPPPTITPTLSKTSPPSHLHIATASLAFHTIIIPPSPLSSSSPRAPATYLSPSLPHLSISARLGAAGVPLTTTLHWLLLMRNLPSSHLLDVHQRDTERDGQHMCVCVCVSEFHRLYLLMECSYRASLFWMH